MPVLEAPDGTRYEAATDHEANNLVVGHGYKLVGNDTDSPEPVTTDPNADPATEQPADSPQPNAEPAVPAEPTPEPAPANPNAPGDDAPTA